MARKTRAEAPQLERGWDEADEQRYQAGESVESARENSDGVTDPPTVPLEPGMRFVMPTTDASQLGKTILEVVAAEAPGYQSRHIELQLSLEEKDLANRLRVGLTERHMKLASGKHVESTNDAVRWLIQQAVQLVGPPASLGS